MTNLSTRLVLQQNPIFGALSPDLIERLTKMARNRKYGAGEIVFREGEPGDVLLGVISGNIDIQAGSDDGRSLNLNRICAGEIIGEIAFLDGGPRTASGKATEPTLCFAIPRKPFRALMKDRSELAEQLLQLLCQRLRWTSDRVVDFAFLTPQARLGRRLLHLAAEAQEVLISQAELARFLGLSRQAVNGYLRDWQDLGAVQLRRGKIEIRSADKLLLAAGLGV